MGPLQSLRGRNNNPTGWILTVNKGKIEMSIWDLAGPLPKLIFIQLQRIEGFRTGSRACGWNEMDLKFLSLATCT